MICDFFEEVLVLVSATETNLLTDESELALELEYVCDCDVEYSSSCLLGQVGDDVSR